MNHLYLYILKFVGREHELYWVVASTLDNARKGARQVSDDDIQHLERVHEVHTLVLAN